MGGVVRADGEVRSGGGEEARGLEHEPGHAGVVAGVESGQPVAERIESRVMRGWAFLPTRVRARRQIDW